ncbi:hypothetical protein MRX96_031839 [Rhipicephalus microplus]|nr:membrane metallo-endopeptidase-like 1 [Rhipicephalus microplus]
MLAERASGFQDEECEKNDSKREPEPQPLEHAGADSNLEVFNHSDLNLTLSPPSEMTRMELTAIPKQQWCTDVNLAMLTGVVCIVWIVVVFLTTRVDSTTHTHVPPRALELPFNTVSYTVPSDAFHQTDLPASTQLSPQISMCSSNLCVQEGNRLRQHMNREYSPCDNFYRYVCEKHPITPGQPYGDGAFTSVDILLEEFLASALRDYVLNEHHRDVASLRALYNACLRPTSNSFTDIQQEVFDKLPIGKWPYKRNNLRTSDIWQTAGLLVRRFGVVSIIEVSFGIKPDTTSPSIELRYPRYLHFDDYSLGGVETLRDAVIEAVRELGSSDDADNLVAQVTFVATTLATLASNGTTRQVLYIKYEDVVISIRTFIQSLFEDELAGDVIVTLREPRLLTEQLQAVISAANVVAFMNYLGFRLIVCFAALFNWNRAASLRSVLSAEIAARVLSPEKNWLLCLRFLERTQPSCLGQALAMQQASAGISASSRFWLAQLEDLFYRNLPHVAWLTGKSLKLLGDKLERLYIIHAIDKSSWNLCTLRPRYASDKGSTLRMFIRAAGEYQRERLRRVNKPSRHSDPENVFGTQSRYSDALQAVYVPVGLVNSSAVANGQLLAFQAARTAVRFYAGLLPVTYEHWDSNLPNADAQWSLSPSSRNSLDQLLDCLASDYQALSSSSFSSLVSVNRESVDERYSLLAQTTALALAYAAFEELLRGEQNQRLDFRLETLSDVSSEQLFFVYYALDNCETTDEAYRVTQFQTRGRLPAVHRVNFPLRHVPQFGRAFRCSDSDATATTERQRPRRCDVMRWNSTEPSSSMQWYRRITQVRAKSFANRRSSRATADVRSGGAPMRSFPEGSWVIAGRDAGY